MGVRELFHNLLKLRRFSKQLNASGGNRQEFRHRRAMAISAAETYCSPKAISLARIMQPMLTDVA
jgi:hypothetical protein